MIDSTRVDEEFDDEVKSKSQIKRDFKALQELGKQLVALPRKQLETMPLSESMRGLIVEAQALKHGVLNRQIRLIGSRMPDEDVASIRQALDTLKQPQEKAVRDLHELEYWRDRLLQDDQTVFAELANTFEHFDRQRVNQLVRNAKREQERNKPPKSSRLLFKYLSELKNLR